MTSEPRLVHIVDDVPELEETSALTMVVVLDGFLDAVIAKDPARARLAHAFRQTQNAKLTLTDGKLDEGGVNYTNLKISANAAIKIPAKDVSYTLKFAPSTGGFSGTFTPNWDSPAAAKPTFKGILIHKGDRKGGYGFFLSNAKDDDDPESGKVILNKQIAAD